MHRPRLALLLTGVALLAGCGEHATAPRNLATPLLPAGRWRSASFPASGIRFRAPRGWFVSAGAAPLVAQASSGLATLAIWRYRRTEHVPRNRRALKAAIPRLLAAVRARDPTFALRSSRTARIDHWPAIHLIGSETVSGYRRLVRSDHVFAYASEVVLDAYAPPGEFPALNRAAFGPMVRSVRVARVP